MHDFANDLYSPSAAEVFTVIGYVVGGYSLSCIALLIFCYIFTRITAFLTARFCPTPHSDTCTCEECFWKNLPLNERNNHYNSMWYSDKASNLCRDQPVSLNQF